MYPTPTNVLESTHERERQGSHIAVALCFEVIKPNFFIHLSTTLTALLESNQNNQLCVYLVSQHLVDEQRQELQDIISSYGQEVAFVSTLTKAQNDLVESMFAKNDTIVQAAYYRLLLPQLLPNESRVLYLDSGDIIVTQDLSELYTRSFEGHLMCGVRDVWSEQIQLKYRSEGEPVSDLYANSGMLLMNLSALRASGWPNDLEAMLDVVDYFPFHDQCMINRVLAGRILELPNTYNTQIVYDGMHKLSRLSHVYHYANSVHELYPVFYVKYFYKLYCKFVDKTRYAGFRPSHPTTLTRALKTVPSMFFIKKLIKRVLVSTGLRKPPPRGRIK